MHLPVARVDGERAAIRRPGQLERTPARAERQRADERQRPVAVVAREREQALDLQAVERLPAVAAPVGRPDLQIPVQRRERAALAALVDDDLRGLRRALVRRRDPRAVDGRLPHRRF